jgi:hypothetical protein
MVDVSTPLEGDVEDTSLDVQTTDTTNDVPVEQTNEPETKQEEAESQTEEQLIFGKYKSLEEAEKGYKEASRSITKVAELEKQLNEYRQREEKALLDREERAKSLGFSNADEQALDFEVKSHEFDLYVQALETTLSGDAYNKVYQALLNYQQTLNPKALAVAKAYFDTDVISKIAGDVAIFKNNAYNKYASDKRASRMAEINSMVSEFAKSTGDWLNPKERQEIVGLAINITGGNIDLPKLKELVDSIEAMAVKSYQEKQNAVGETEQLTGSLVTPQSHQNINNEKWFSREEYMAMSEAEEEANYDKIARQIELEKQGKLPRRLT